MAHLWLHTTAQEWTIMPLDGEVWTLTGHYDQPVQVGRAMHDGHSAAVLMSSQDAGKEKRWVLIAPPEHSVRVNGERVVLGLCTLSDKDEIRVPGGVSFFFSTEKLASVELFPGLGDQRCFCPRCKQEITTDCPSVQCPQCGVYHHQSDDLPCYTYSEHCTVCDQSSSLDADYRWTPEDL